MEAGVLLSRLERNPLELSLDDIEALVKPELSSEWEAIVSHLEYLEDRDNQAKLAQYPLAQDYAEDTISTYPHIYPYALSNSIDIAIYEASLMSSEWLDRLSARERIVHAMKAYMSFTGTHTMHNRIDILKTIAEELEQNLMVEQNLPHPADYELCSPWYDRVLASVFEELSDTTDDVSYLEKADIINQTIVESSDIPWHSGYKIHALFAKYDSLFRHFISDHDHVTQRQAQVDFYQDIIWVAAKATGEQSENINIEAMTSSLFEALCVGMLRDEALKKSNSHKIRSAYVREDYSLPIKNPESNKLFKIPTLSFDIVMYKQSDQPHYFNRVNIELKKGKNGTSPRSLPGIICVKAHKNKLNGVELAEAFVNYAEGRINHLVGAPIKKEQEIAIEELDEIFNTEELMHRYHYRRPEQTTA